MKRFHFLTTNTENNTDQTAGATRVAIPRVVVIGGQEFSIADTPELATLVSAIRQDAAFVERSKLYPAFEKLKKEAQILADAQIIDPSGNAQEEAVITKAEARINLMLENLSKQIEPLLAANAKNEVQSLEAYRNSLLQDNVGKVIPELVVGTTKEELDAAFAQSKELCSKYAPQFGVASIESQMQHAPIPAQTAPAVPQTQATTAPAVTFAPTPTDIAPAVAPVATPAPVAPAPERTIVLPSSPTNTEMASTEAPNVSSMSMAEFAKRREELHASLTGVMGN